MEQYNPWWVNEEDEDYLKWSESKVKWVPRILDEISLAPFSLNFVVGPRQVGKTTALKIFLHNTLLKKNDPISVFYYSCDDLSDYKELGEVLDTYLSFRKSRGVKNSFIVLDEITFVKEWERALKSRIDRNIFKKDILVVTGSASVEILKQRESFPGRRGYGRDIIFHPMDFQQYLEIFAQSKLNLKQGSLENHEDLKNMISANKIFSKTISCLFENYMKTGGFPIPIKDFFGTNKISNNAIKIYLEWLKGDWKSAGKSDKYMKEVLSYIIKARLSPVSWNNIASETSINSSHTVQNYVELLESMFAVKVLHMLSPDGKVCYRKNKKIHLTDPFLYKIISGFTRNDVYDETILESIPVSHLMRKYDVYFWKNKTEVGSVIQLQNDIQNTGKNKKQIGFEVKTQMKAWKKPWHLDDVFILYKETLPLFLASVKWS